MHPKSKFHLALAGAMLLLAPVNAATAGNATGGNTAGNSILIHRDPGCGCCSLWAKQISRQLGREAKMLDNPKRGALVQRLGIPASLWSCHTAIIDGVVVEGHVPAADIQHFLATRPKGMTGIAVGGMPIGSPGMEVPGQKPQPYAVMAFGPGKQALFATH